MTLIGSWIAWNVRNKQGFKNGHKAVIAAARKAELTTNLQLKKAQEKAVGAEELEEEDSENTGILNVIQTFNPMFNVTVLSLNIVFCLQLPCLWYEVYLPE